MRNSHCSTTVANKGLIERAKPYYNRAKDWAYQKKDTIVQAKDWAYQKKDAIVNAATNNKKIAIGAAVGIGVLTVTYRSRQRIKQGFNIIKKGFNKVKDAVIKLYNKEDRNRTPSDESESEQNLN